MPAAQLGSPENKYSASAVLLVSVSVLSLFLMLWIPSRNRLFARLGAPRRFHCQGQRWRNIILFCVLQSYNRPPAWLSHSRVTYRTDRVFMDKFRNRGNTKADHRLRWYHRLNTQKCVILIKLTWFTNRVRRTVDSNTLNVWSFSDESLTQPHGYSKRSHSSN